MSDESTPALELHPIQLKWVAIRELFIKTHKPGSREFELGPGEFDLTDGHSDYDHEKKELQVMVRAEIGSEEDDGKIPFCLRVEIVGSFKVNESRFPIELVDRWASKGAPMVLYPYLRENVQALTTRCGLPGVILPLLQLPTVKITSEKVEKAQPEEAKEQ